MNWRQKLGWRLRALWRKRDLDASMNAEMRAHIELQTEEHIREGMSSEEARRAACREFGSSEAIKETCRDARGVSWIENITRDVRHAARRLVNSPGFTSVGLLTLGVCLGANLVIFAVVDAILLRPLPFPEAERLVIAVHSYPKADIEHMDCSIPNYYDWRRGIPAFASVSASQPGNVDVTDGEVADRVPCELVSPEFFATLRVSPALGRFFFEEEMHPDRGHLVMLTDSFWRAHYHNDPAVIGRSLRVNGQASTIIGVLPPHFRYLSSRAQLYLPLTSTPRDREPDRRHSGNTQVIARLAPGATLANAQAQINASDARQMVDDPYAEQLKSAGAHTRLFPLHADHVRSIRPTLMLLQAGAFSLLLIGGVNLMNLLLVRAGARAKEFAVRQALGADRRHLIRETLAETLLFALAGGVLGLAVGMIGVKLLASLGAAELPLGARVALDARVAVAALVSALAAGLVLAGPVIWLNLRGQVTTALKSESRGGTVSRAVRRWGHGLIVAQITLAFVLLAGAGLLASSLRRVLAVSPGFHPEHVLTVQLGLTADRYRDEKTRLAFADRLLGAARALPGVNHAAVSTSPPFAGEPEKTIITAEGHTRAPGESIRAHYLSSVIGDVWQTLGIPLRAGRLLEDADNRGPARVCVVDEVFAQRYWPGQSALGRRVAKDPNFTPEEALTIVGVVGQIKHGDLADTSALGAVYRPYRYDVAETIHLLLRSSLPPSALSATLQKAIHGLDPELPVQNPRPLQEHIDASLVQRRAPALLASCYAAVALLLAAIGIYGVFAYVTSRRQREIGVRLALGALPGQIRNQFLATGARLLATGVVLGGAGAWLVGRAMRAMLFGVPPFHWATLAMTAAIMGAVSLAACAIPARRATKVSPASALNAE